MIKVNTGESGKYRCAWEMDGAAAVARNSKNKILSQRRRGRGEEKFFLLSAFSVPL